MVVGLGNPGKRYQRTRHNAGFLVLNELARRHGGSFRRNWRVSAQSCKLTIENEAALLVKPQAFMNRSGLVVAPLLRKKGLAPDALIVVSDDVNLDPGCLRVRARGGAGGHNGLKSVVDVLGTEDFVRIRVGVGKCEPGEDLVNYVLSPFRGEERDVITEVVKRAADAAESLFREGVERTMNAFNGA